MERITSNTICLLAVPIFFLIPTISIILKSTSYSSNEVLDPRKSLTLKNIRIILDHRGIDYSNCNVKEELIELVEHSGSVTRSELEKISASKDVVQSNSQYYFKSGSNYQAVLKDTEGSPWLIQIISNRVPTVINESSWRSISAYLEPFSIKTGILNCSLAKGYCARKRWYSTLLVLTGAAGHKENKFITSLHPKAIVSWVGQHLADRLEMFTDINSARHWLDNNDRRDLQVMLITHLRKPPLFFTSLSINFAGRVRFAMLRIQKSNTEITRIKAAFNIKSDTMPLYFISTPNSKYQYGVSQGQYFDFNSMKMFLSFTKPDANNAVDLAIFVCFTSIVISLVKKSSGNSVLKTIYKYCGICACIVIIILFINEISILSNWVSYITQWFSLSYFGMKLIEQFIFLINCHNYTLIFFILSVAYLWCINQLSFESLSETNTNERENIVTQQKRSTRLKKRECISKLPRWKYGAENEKKDKSLNYRVPEVKSDSGTKSSHNPDRKVVHFEHERPDIVELVGTETHLVREETDSDVEVPEQIESGSNTEQKVEFLEELEWKCYTNTGVTKKAIGGSFIKNPPKNKFDSTDCPICLEAYRSEESMCGLPCGHAFHDKCIKPWLQKNNKCPICRCHFYKRKHD